MGSDVKNESESSKSELNVLHKQQSRIGEGLSNVISDEDEQYYSAREVWSSVKTHKHKSGPLSMVSKMAVRKLDASFSTRPEDTSNYLSGSNATREPSPHTSEGFLANRLIVRDLILIIKDSLPQLTASHFEISNNSELKAVEKELGLMTLTSVTETNFMSRSSQLQQKVNEAWWRHKLILQDSVGKEFGSTIVRSVGQDSSLDDEGYAAYERSLHKSAGKSNIGIKKGGESSQESEMSSEFLTYSSGANAQSTVPKNKRYRKRKNRHSSKGTPGKWGLISRMLSSPSSLLNMCIKRQSYKQAREVVKLFNLEESADGKAFAFSETHKQFVEALSKEDRPRSLSSGKAAGGAGALDLSLIRQAAASSLSTMGDSTKAEKLAVSAIIPPGVNVKENQIAKFLGSNESNVATAMVLLDLACVSTSDPQLCQQLLSSAQKYLSSPSQDRKAPVAGIQNWLKLCVNINELALTSDPEKMGQLLNRESDNISIRCGLLSGLLSLDSNDIQERVFPLIDICDNVNAVESAVQAWRASRKEDFEAMMLPSKSLLQLLSKHFPGAEKQYLSDLYEQIKLLHKVIQDNTSNGSDVSYLSVFEVGPTMIMGRLMFDSKVKPSNLESAAKKVKLDLTHVIVRSCCPPVRCKPLQRESLGVSDADMQQPMQAQTDYRIILNGKSNDAMAFDLPPLDVVSSALRMLLKLVEGTLALTSSSLLTKELAEDVTDMPDYTGFCAQCEKLRRVDLSKLYRDDERLTFFVNLHNLLSLHGVITTLASANKKQSVSVNSISIVLALQLRTSYVVGQLGVCSIFELEQFLLRASSKVHQLDLSMEHPWFCYAPLYNPLTTFLLYDGSVNVLKVKCVSAHSIDNEISDAVTRYMRQAVIISPQTKQILIPELLLRVRSELVIEVQGAMTPKYQHSEILLWILDYQPTTRWSEMRVIMDNLEHLHDSSSKSSEGEETESQSSDSLASVEILAPNHRLGFSLDTEATLAQLLSPEEPSLDPLSEEWESSYRLTPSDMNLHKAKFKISDVAVQYLREKSPVVAMLLDIIYKDLMSHGSTEEQASRFDSEMLRRDYINLHRYLHEYIIPLCIYIKEIKSVSQLAQVDMPPHIQAAILTHKSCLYLENAGRKCIDSLCLDDKFDLVVSVIDNLMALTAEPSLDWQAVRDYASIQSASESVSSESLQSIKCLHCERLQAHVTISCLHKSRWTVEKCLLMLPLCERRLSETGDRYLLPHLKTITERMSTFHRIMLHAQAKQSQVVEGCSPKVVNLLASGWQSVAGFVVDHPSEVFHLLFDAQEFLFAKKLVDLRKDIDQGLKLLVYKRYIVNTLDKTSNTDEIVEVLVACLHDDVQFCFLLCVEVLNDLEKPGGMLIVVQFMNNEMIDSLGKVQKTSIQLCLIGVQMLMKMEKRSRAQYRSLIFTPFLLFEQLLMNAKISCAVEVVSLLDVSTSDLLPNYTEEVNALLVYYAQKAVDFPVLYVSGDSSSGSAGSASGSSPALKTVRTLARIGSPVTPSPLQKALLGSSLRKSSASSPQAPLSRLSRITTAPGSLSALSTDHPVGVVGSPSLMVSPLPEKTKKRYALPDRAPTREEWVADEKAAKCMLCQLETFSMFNRRHHCRRCGRVVCAGCSARTAPVGGRSVRVCDDCYESMFKSREILEQQDGTAKKLREKLSGSSTPVASPVTTLQISLPPADSFTTEWVLSPDEEENNEIRRDFFYDHAPSVSLCTAILKMYNNEIESGKHMLNLCEKLSHIIKPIRPEAINQEVDYNLVISMMKFLLLNAKLLFVEQHYADGVAQCEVYSNRVDVLSLLLTDYYLNLPTVEELSKIDNIRRLRDRLLEDERPELALEISTKFGLETNVIWSAWGLSSLRKADYSGARAKFSKFLKPLADKHSQTVAYSSLLDDIVTTLEGQASQVNSTYTKASIISTLKALTSGQDLSKSVPVQAWDACRMDENLEHVQECLHYLKLYGNHQMLISFYRSHGFWQKAVQYCLDKRCSSELFITCLFLPAVRDGELSFFQDQLLLIDSSLVKCSSYLMAVCRHLTRNAQFHTLYQVQLFTKDYIRAAMTCVQMFYIQDAKTYTDLSNRSNYLNKALDHYQSYLNPAKLDRGSRSRTSQQSRSSVESSLKLIKSESEVRGLISSIKLQMEVSKHLVSSDNASRERAITLFGEAREKITLASRVIVAGKNLSNGFEIAFRIIQDYQLSYNEVYTMAAQHLGERRAYSQVKQLVTCIKDSGLCDAQLLDRVLLTAIRAAISTQSSSSSDLEALSKLLRLDSSKIEALIMCGKLKNAYLLAVKSSPLEVISRIAEEAVKLNQMRVKSLCDRYLESKRASGPQY